MARPRLGAREWYDEKTDKFFIRDIGDDGKPVKFSLGFGKKDTPDYLRRVEAEKAKYIAKKHAGGARKVKNQDTSDVLVSDVIALYADVRIRNFIPDRHYKKAVARPEDVIKRLKTLVEFFGDMTLDELDEDSRDDFVKFLHRKAVERAHDKHERTMARYQEQKAKFDKAAVARVGTRREALEPKRKAPIMPQPFDPKSVEFKPLAALRYLEDLNAAIACALRRRLIRADVHMPLTAKYDRRTTIFSFEQVVRLISHAYFKRGMGWVDGKPKQGLYVWRHLARAMLLLICTGSRKTRVTLASFNDEGDRPWIELVEAYDPETGKNKWRGWLHRLGDDEVEHDNKRAPKVELNPLAVKYCVRWKRQGIIYPCLFPYSPSGQDEPGELAQAMRRCFREVLGEDTDAVIHTFRHTTATWLCQQPQLPLVSIAGWLGMSVETLVTTYAKYREEDLKKVTDAFADMGDFVGRKASRVGQKLTETDRNAMIEIMSDSFDSKKSSIISIVRSGCKAA
ncbi:hypothetical protein [Shinella zoogloeoides]|uniref:hypothetical protein n=1 Tax=Shinella zoogloeoides TaxID=352475 RepID=UPI00299CD693|nr:hypothetical protein [Shinella zoogloeoides]WPE23502.1 hypothetical protein ShzoTeo12_47220 [Shinella zoogloeoides]